MRIIISIFFLLTLHITKASDIVAPFPAPIVTIDSINAGKDTMICATDIITLGGSRTAPSGMIIRWSPSTYFLNPSDTNIANPQIAPTGNITYYLEVTDPSDNTVARDSIVVSIKKQPGAFAGPDTTICSAAQVNLNAFGGKIYSWQPAGLVLQPTDSSTKTRTINSDTSFTVIISGDPGFCTTVDTVNVSLFSASSVQVGQRLLRACDTDSIELAKNIQAPPGSIFSWSPSLGLNDSTLANPKQFLALSSTPPDTSIYRLTVKDNSGTCSALDSVTVIRDTAVQVKIQPLLPNDSICAGEKVLIIALNAVSYRWNLPMDSVGVPGGTKFNTNIGGIWPDTTTKYIVTGTDVNGCQSKDSVTLYVFKSPKIESPISDTVFLCQGDSISITATKGAKTYAWTPNFNILPDTTVDSVMVYPTSDTTYFIEIDSLGVCSARDSVYIMVNNALSVNILVNETLQCKGDTFLLKSVVPGKSSNMSFNWLSTSFMSNATGDSTKAVISDASSFKLTVTQGSCSGVDSITIYPKPSPDIPYLKDTFNVCNGGSITIAGSGPGSGQSYLWSPGNTLDDSTKKEPLATPTSDTKYMVTITGSNGCTLSKEITVLVGGSSGGLTFTGDTSVVCQGIPVQLSVTGATGYVWTPSTGLSDDSIANPIATLDTTTTFVVKATSGGGSSCGDSLTIKITVDTIPKINAGDTIISCVGDTVLLGGKPTGDPRLQYSWSPTEDLDSSWIPNPTSFYTLNRKYFLLVQDANGCEAIDSVSVLRYAISAVANDLECSKDSVSLDVVRVDGTKPFVYKWYPNYNLSSTTIKNPKAKPDSSYVYTVEVTDSMGCKDSVRVDVPRVDLVRSIFDVKIQASCSDALATTNNTSQNASSFKWYLDGKEIGTDYNMRIPIPFNSTKTISLLALNAEGCKDSAIVSRDIKAFEDYFDGKIPNVFTPNDDGINDEFEIQLGQRLEQCSDIKIWNRWGELVFESRDQHHTWDGRTFSGEVCAQGVYFFVLSVNGITYKGHVTLIK